MPCLQADFNIELYLSKVIPQQHQIKTVKGIQYGSTLFIVQMLPLKLAFLQIFDKHFPKSHKFHKLFNRNNLKVSYRSRSNIASIINSHNKKTLRKEKIASAKPHCNCRAKESCPLNGDCLKSIAVYGCKITSSDTVEDSPHYIGLTENTFKDNKHD